MAKVSLFLDARHETTNGYPVKVRVTHNNTNAARSTGIFLFSEQWDKLHSQATDVKNASVINTNLYKMVVKLYDTIDDLDKKGRLPHMKAAQIIAAAEGVAASMPAQNDNSFGGWLKQYADQSRTKKTKVSFEYTMRTIMNYVHTYSPKVEKIFFDEINYEFLFSFRKWMEKTGMSVSTRRIHEVNIRTIFNHACKCGFVKYDNNPFNKYRMETYTKKKVYLELKYLHRIMMLDFSQVSGREGLELARDAFLLSFYLQGASPIDVFNMKKPVDNWVHYVRQKIEWHKPLGVDVWLTPEAKIIIAKYSKSDRLVDWHKKYRNFDSFYSFIRHRLDRIGEMIGCPEITWYWARYTWGTYAQKTSYVTGANDFAIDTMMGHTPSTLTGRVYASFEKEDGIPISTAVVRFATEGVHWRCVPAPKFIHKRGNPYELTDVWKDIDSYEKKSQPAPQREPVEQIESYFWNNTVQNYTNFSKSPNLIYQNMTI